MPYSDASLLTRGRYQPEVAPVSQAITFACISTTTIVVQRYATARAGAGVKFLQVVGGPPEPVRGHPMLVGATGRSARLLGPSMFP